MDRPLPTPPPVPAVSAADPAAPAAPPPLPWYQAAAAYLLAAGVTVGVLTAGQRLDTADFRAPFAYSGDVLLILPFVKATVEGGSHWRTDRLGAPGVQELHDFPVVDHLHFAVIWLLGRVWSDPVVVFNLFHVLTYPLTTVSAMFVLRRFGLSLPAAGTGGLLYAFQPYHYLRGESHYFLAAYYVVPLTLLVCLWVCRGRVPFFRREPGGRYRFAPLTADALAATAIALATASAGAYYAFFACALLACAGVYGWVAAGTWRAAAGGGLVVALVAAGGVANHLPAFAYQAAHGKNTRPTQRWAEEAEMYGLKIVQMVLPAPGHNNVEVNGRVLVDVAAVRTRYGSNMRPLYKFAETDTVAVGAVATAGFVGLLAAAVLPARRRWPVGPLAALTLFATLLGTVGGVGDVFNLLVTPQIRCHNRISIYIAFLALFAVCWWVDRFFRTRTGPARRLRWPAFLLLGAFGVWDQTDDTWFPQLRHTRPGYEGADVVRERAADQFRADRRFFARVEELMPDGAVFTFPFVPYPEAAGHDEAGSPGRTDSYDHVRGYLHTARLRWSFGAMKGREWDLWGRAVAVQPPREMLRRVVLAGFDGLLVDDRGLNPGRAEWVFREIDAVLGRESPRVADPALGLTFFDLRGYRNYLLGTYGPAGFEALSKAEHASLDMAVLWLKGFDSYEQPGYDNRQRWCQADCHMVLVNPTDAPRRVTVRMGLRYWFQGVGVLRIDGGEVWTDEVEVTHAGRLYVRQLDIPPGRHAVRFRCPPPPGQTFADSRDLVFGVKDFRIE